MRTSSLAPGEHVHALEDALLQALVVLKQVVDTGILPKPAVTRSAMQIWSAKLRSPNIQQEVQAGTEASCNLCTTHASRDHPITRFKAPLHPREVDNRVNRYTEALAILVQVHQFTAGVGQAQHRNLALPDQRLQGRCISCARAPVTYFSDSLWRADNSDAPANGISRHDVCAYRKRTVHTGAAGQVPITCTASQQLRNSFTTS